MSFGTLGDYRRRRRRAAFWRTIQLVALVGVVVGAAAYAYQVGVSASHAMAAKLEDDLERFQSDNLALRERLSGEARRAEEAGRQLEDLRQRYRADVPTGTVRDLLDEIVVQLEDGVEAERLSLMIDLAGRPAACAEQPETKRFMPATPVAADVVNAVRFGDGRIVVTGRGQSARNDQGLAEAWFDPAASLDLTFRMLGGEREEISGTLPIRHSMVVDGIEYRFAAIAGERAFIEITAQACEIPGLRPDGPEEGEASAADETLPGDLPG